MTLPSLDFRDPLLASSIAEHSLVISASAGSGKTFALVTLVLGFLGRGGRAFQVVATTFGREAASDLRSRILQPLDQLAGWKAEEWEFALKALDRGFDAWDAWLASRDPAVRPEIGAAARQWLANREKPAWTQSAVKARAHWIQARREAELLQATTVHAMAQAVLRKRGTSGEALLEADDPVLVRLLRTAGREVLRLDDAHPDTPAARRLWAWCEGFEEDRDRWNLLAAAFDAHLDALGTWRDSVDAAVPRERFLREARKLLEAYAAFAAEPMQAATFTKQGKPAANFVKYGLPKFEAEPVPADDVARLMEALERLATRFLKDDGEPPNYYSDSFVAVLEPLGNELTEHFEGWMTLLLERVFQRFRNLKTQRGFHSYGDLVREAWDALRAAPEAEPPALLLVDEYQDINPVQEAFLEALRARRTILVGDPKQAIYGFRGGAPELLRAKLQRSSHAFRLPVNHRSSAPIVELANAFVREVVPGLDAASADTDGLQEHCGQGARERLVALAAVPSDKTRGSDLQSAAPWVAALAKNEGWSTAGFAERDGRRRRALLLPRRTGLPGLRRMLQAHHVEPLVQSREGFWDSPGVRLMMALLETAARPEAEAARMAVLRLGATNAELKAHANGESTARMEAGLGWLRQLASQTTQGLVAEALARPGLLEFLSATSVHGLLEPARARRNLERFLGWIPALPEAPALAWAELDRLRSFSDPGDAPAEDASADLVVQTIHGAKGLEYDDVILPLLANDVKGVRKGTIRQRSKLPGPLWMGWKLGHARGPALKELQGEESRRVFREGLNLLYVGLTRAKGRMALLQQWPLSKDGIPGPPPSGSQRRAEGKGVQWHHLGSDLVSACPDLPRLTEIPAVTAMAEIPREVLMPPASGREAVSLPAQEPESAGDRVRKGIQIHALLREVLVRETIDPEAARAYLARHPLTQRWAGAAGLVDAVLQEMGNRHWRHLPRRTEFELPGSGQRGGAGRADLVIWESDRSQPECIHLVDFKLAMDFTPEVLELHCAQLMGYREALAEQHPGARIEAWVVALEGKSWVKVSPE